MSSSRTRPTGAEWLQQKPNIKRMIIDQNMSQEEARQRLKDGGLLVSKAQLEYKLKTWGFRKKIPKKKSDDIWQYVGHRIEKRKRQDNKDSDVFLNGRLLDPAKVRKEINRHQPSVDNIYAIYVANLPPMATISAQSFPIFEFPQARSGFW
ncbi:hypothetical protein CGCF413_v003955 [Colletotrichum fructicola]|nr:hypothetical protein CFRS1_v010918 [Colletotrichum fructicola]KAF5509860.1 hypothetical protein CGCF413_v003955 [Colletotrichum fructicola]